MSSLVADYGSESDSDANPELGDEGLKVQCEDSAGAERPNYLISNPETSSSEDEGNTPSTADTSKEKLPNPLLEKFPTPELNEKANFCVSKTTDGPGSVFANPFEKAEMAKQSVLEKHVKMTEAQLLTGKKAKVCRAFKQGRCRFGNNCKFSHDIDANLSLRYTQDNSAQEVSQNVSEISGRSKKSKFPQLPPPPKQQQGFMGTMGTMHSGPKHVSTHRQRVQYVQQQNYMETADVEDDDKFNVGDKRKKRVGLSQTLVPPKKAMSALAKQRQEERPWTMNRK